MRPDQQSALERHNGRPGCPNTVFLRLLLSPNERNHSRSGTFPTGRCHLLHGHLDTGKAAAATNPALSSTEERGSGEKALAPSSTPTSPRTFQRSSAVLRKQFTAASEVKDHSKRCGRC